MDFSKSKVGHQSIPANTVYVVEIVETTIGTKVQ